MFSAPQSRLASVIFLGTNRPSLMKIKVIVIHCLSVPPSLAILRLMEDISPTVISRVAPASVHRHKLVLVARRHGSARRHQIFKNSADAESDSPHPGCQPVARSAELTNFFFQLCVPLDSLDPVLVQRDANSIFAFTVPAPHHPILNAGLFDGVSGSHRADTKLARLLFVQHS